MGSIKYICLGCKILRFEKNNDRGRVDTISSDFRHCKMVVDKGRQTIKTEHLTRMDFVITLEEKIKMFESDELEHQRMNSSSHNPYSNMKEKYKMGWKLEI